MLSVAPAESPLVAPDWAGLGEAGVGGRSRVPVAHHGLLVSLAFGHLIFTESLKSRNVL